ncbi:hypothetical protein ACWEFL_02600 [Streptomyces sp. NPDC004838]
MIGSRRLRALLAALNRRHQARVPAAPDNQPGIDVHTLWTCRRIAATPPRKDT